MNEERQIACVFTFPSDDLSICGIDCDNAKLEFYISTTQTDDQLVETQGKIAKYFEDDSAFISTCDCGGAEDEISFDLVDMEDEAFLDTINKIYIAWQYFIEQKFFE